MTGPQAPRRDGAARLRLFGATEDGSVTVFSLFIFLMMLFVGGMAVDLIRFETRRTELQNTLDTATLAAASIRSNADADALVRSFMETRGYDANAVNVSVNEVRSGADPATGNNGVLAARGVTATYDLDINTIFMPLLGIDSLGGAAGGAAQEGLTTVEISLVVDVSGSMGGTDASGTTKLAGLKTAAKNFVNQVIDPARTDMPVTISVVPYSHDVVVPDSILRHLNSPTGPVPIPQQQQEPFLNHLDSYAYNSTKSRCVRFDDSTMITSDLEEGLAPAMDPNYLLLRAITTTQVLDRIAHYNYSWPAGSDPMARPNDTTDRWCNPARSPILPFEADIPTLETYIDALFAYGNTAIDVGLKWGVALLDPAFRDVVNEMINDGDLPPDVAGRPYDYNPNNFMKVVILMTDGQNTTQYDIGDEHKRGASPVWYSSMAAGQATGPSNNIPKPYQVDNQIDNGDGTYSQGSDGKTDRPNEWYDGYYIYRPDAAGNARWFRPHDPLNPTDGVTMPMGWNPPSDARQLDYVELYDRFSAYALAMLFRDDTVGDVAAYNAHLYAEEAIVSGADADRRMTGKSDDSEYGICDAAKVNNDILIYTIAFNASAHGEATMRDCATSPGHYFNAQDGAALQQAFSSIGASILSLRLTQ